MRAATLAVLLSLALAACTASVEPPSASPGAIGSGAPRATPLKAGAGCVEEGGELRYAHRSATVRGTLLRPVGGGPFPAALILHTRGGLNAHAVAEVAWLASQGFVTYAPDYFGPIGVTPASFDRQTFTARYSDEVRELLGGAIACLRTLANVERSGVGVVGFSLGGYFAALLAARDDVSAAVAWYAAYAGSPVNQVPAQQAWTEVAAAAKRPLLLLHGDADQDVRVDLARRAAAELDRLGKRSELIVYPGVGHGYDQEGSIQYRYDASATADSRWRTVALLRSSR